MDTLKDAFLAALRLKLDGKSIYGNSGRMATDLSEFSSMDLLTLFEDWLYDNGKIK